MDKLGRRGVSRVRDFILRGANSLPLTERQIVEGKLGEFIQMMKNRVLVGTCRHADMYGDINDTVPQNGDQLVHEMLTKVALFLMTRNHEMLLDIANYAALIYNFDDHDGAYFKAEDQGEGGTYMDLKVIAADYATSWRRAL